MRGEEGAKAAAGTSDLLADADMRALTRRSDSTAVGSSRR